MICANDDSTPDENRNENIDNKRNYDQEPLLLHILICGLLSPPVGDVLRK